VSQSSTRFSLGKIKPKTLHDSGDKYLDMYRQLRDKVRLKHFSIRTERAYVHRARQFIVFHGKRHPETMGPGEVEAFLTHLAVKHGVAASTQHRPAVPYCFSVRVGAESYPGVVSQYF
jgi:hypothetical protein